MIQIDLDADLNWVDDEDRNIGKANDAAARFKVGDVVIAGRPGGRTWALIDEVDEPWVFFRPITAEQARAHGPLELPASA
jgi:hypothetical protein